MHGVLQDLHPRPVGTELSWIKADSNYVADSYRKCVVILVPQGGRTLTIRAGDRLLPSPLADELGLAANICMSCSIPDLSGPVLAPPADEQAVHHS